MSAVTMSVLLGQLSLGDISAIHIKTALYRTLCFSNQNDKRRKNGESPINSYAFCQELIHFHWLAFH